MLEDSCEEKSKDSQSVCPLSMSACGVSVKAIPKYGLSPRDYRLIVFGDSGLLSISSLALLDYATTPDVPYRVSWILLVVVDLFVSKIIDVLSTQETRTSGAHSGSFVVKA
jgi:hypothetical protein